MAWYAKIATLSHLHTCAPVSMVTTASTQHEAVLHTHVSSQGSTGNIATADWPCASLQQGCAIQIATAQLI